MPGPQQVQQPAGQVGLVPVGGRADGGTQQAAGAGLGQHHHPQRRVAGQAQPVADLADPGPVALSVRDLQGVQAIERDGAQPSEAHSWGSRLGQRPGDDLEQRFQRGRAEAAAQIPQGLLRWRRKIQPGQPGGQLAPHPHISQAREHPQRQDEVDPGARGQVAQPPLHRPASATRTSSTSSNGRYWVNSPRCPGAYTPAAALTAWMTVAVADSVRNGTSGGREDRDGLTRSTRGPVSSPATPRRTRST